MENYVKVTIVWMDLDGELCESYYFVDGIKID
jgi:hypothetical protein